MKCKVCGVNFERKPSTRQIYCDACKTEAGRKKAHNAGKRYCKRCKRYVLAAYFEYNSRTCEICRSGSEPVDAGAGKTMAEPGGIAMNCSEYDRKASIAEIEELKMIYRNSGIRWRL